MILNRISRKLTGFSKLGTTLVVLVIFIVFFVVILPHQSAAMNTYSGELGSPDLSLFYSPKDLYQMAEQYGSAGREAYVRARFTFDLIFPVIYTLFLVTSISRVLGAVLPKNSRWCMLNLAPIAGMILDLLENTATSFVMSRYPALSPLSANLAPVFTLLKWIFVVGSFLILFSSAIALLLTCKKARG